MVYCETCKFFIGLEQICIRYPPTLLMVQQGPMGKPAPASMYPPQKKTNTCGEYSAALEVVGKDA